MRLLVTGHTGFIGSKLTQELKTQGRHEVIGVSRSAGFDLLERDCLANIGQVDKIIHLAGTLGVVESWADPHAFYQGNVLSTLNLLEFARSGKVPLVLLSSYVYGIAQYLPVDEKHPVECSNPYSRSKRLAELLCIGYAKDFGIPLTILRPFNVYGSSQKTDNIISHVVTQLQSGDRIRVKDLTPKRDFLHVDDLVSAIILSVAADNGLNIYNVGFGKSHSVLEIIECAARIADRRISIESANEQRPNEIMDCYANVEKFRSAFGWTPKVSLESGLRELLK